MYLSSLLLMSIWAVLIFFTIINALLCTFQCMPSTSHVVEFLQDIHREVELLELRDQGRASQVVLVVNEPAHQGRRCKRQGLNLWVGKIPWRRAWQPSLVFLPGESHGQRGLAGYSPWGCKKSDMTEATQHARRQGVGIFNITCMHAPSLSHV